MMYLDKTGRQIDEKDALDAHGAIKDGIVMRVSLRDSQSVRRQSSRLRVTDSSGGADGLQKPGYRLPVSGLLSTDAVAARDQAYSDHEAYLKDAYKEDSGPS